MVQQTAVSQKQGQEQATALLRKAAVLHQQAATLIQKAASLETQAAALLAGQPGPQKHGQQQQKNKQSAQHPQKKTLVDKNAAARIQSAADRHISHAKQPELKKSQNGPSATSWDDWDDWDDD